MKLLLLTGAFLLPVAAFTQSNSKAPTREEIARMFEAYRQRNLVAAHPIDSSVLRLNNFLTLSKKPGVYRLPQDGMPCLVPDPARTVPMPNLWAGRVEVPFRGNRIPNAAKPKPRPKDTK